MFKNLLKSGIFWTIVVGAVGILITILIFELSNKTREPVYIVKKEPSLIFNKNSASPKLKLLTNDSVIVNNNVYIVTLVMWNNGKLEIKKEDVRKKFVLETIGNTVILDYNIVKETNPEISNFRIVPKNDSLIINWDYFDPGFGCQIDVIYAGNNQSGIIIDGYVLGAKVKKIQGSDEYKDAKFLISILLIILILILGIFLSYYLVRKRLAVEMVLYLNTLVSKVLVGLFLAFLISITYYFLTRVNVPL